MGTMVFEFWATVYGILGMAFNLMFFSPVGCSSLVIGFGLSMLFLYIHVETEDRKRRIMEREQAAKGQS